MSDHRIHWQPGVEEIVAREVAKSGVGTGYAVNATFHDPLTPGTRVLAWPGDRTSSPLVTRTRSEVWTLPAGDRVVTVEGYAGGIALTHIDVLPYLADPEEKP